MRLIDADKLIEAITADIMLSGFGRCNGKTLRTNVLKEVRQMIADAPTVEAKPIHRSTRTDENGVKWVFGEHGWVRKEG